MFTIECYERGIGMLYIRDIKGCCNIRDIIQYLATFLINIIKCISIWLSKCLMQNRMTYDKNLNEIRANKLTNYKFQYITSG